MFVDARGWLRSPDGGVYAPGKAGIQQSAILKGWTHDDV